MPYTSYPLTQSGIEEAENTWHDQAVSGEVKFGVDKKSGRLVVIPKSDAKNYRSAMAFATPREAEQATVNRQPTRSLIGGTLGAIIAPRGQYHVTNPIARDSEGNLYPNGRKGDPIRAEQSNIGKDIVLDRIANLAAYGPTLAMLNQQVSKLPTAKVIPGMAGLSLGLNLAGMGLGTLAGDPLYNETLGNALLTAGGTAAGAALLKASSKRAQQDREVDALIRRKLRIPKDSPVPKELHDAVVEGGKAGTPYTMEDWRYQPLDDLTKRYPHRMGLPVKFGTYAPPVTSGHVMSRTGRPSEITPEVANDWMTRNRVNPNAYDIGDVMDAIGKMYIGRDQSRTNRAFYPTAATQPITMQDWVNWVPNESNPVIADLLRTNIEVDDPEVNAEFQKAKQAFKERSSRGRGVIRNAVQTEGNQGLATGKSTPIVPQEKFEKLGEKGKWTRRAGTLGGLAIPVMTELFGKFVLPRGNNGRN